MCTQSRRRNPRDQLFLKIFLFGFGLEEFRFRADFTFIWWTMSGYLSDCCRPAGLMSDIAARVLNWSRQASVSSDALYIHTCTRVSSTLRLCVCLFVCKVVLGNAEDCGHLLITRMCVLVEHLIPDVLRLCAYMNSAHLVTRRRFADGYVESWQAWRLVSITDSVAMVEVRALCRTLEFQWLFVHRRGALCLLIWKWWNGQEMLRSDWHEVHPNTNISSELAPNMLVWGHGIWQAFSLCYF